MVSRFILLFILLGITACGQNVQQALAPDPRLLPSSPAPTPTTSASTVSISPPPTSPSPTIATPTPQPSASVTSSEDLAALTELGVFSAREARQPAGTIVTKRAYARWLLMAHNQIYQTKPSQQLRLATTDTPPVFTDVPTTDPDFIAIQSLANAGIIPSSLNGTSTPTSFQPDISLTREQLVQWKIPLDRRQALPLATVATVQKNWGFQDTAKISPPALPAVLADYENGDRSNIRRAFGYTTLFQPQKPVTLAEVVATIWYFGTSDGRSAQDAITDSIRVPSPALQP
jgi:S-layer homology domain